MVSTKANAEIEREKKEMKNYKDFEKIYIGDSDIAALTLRTVGKVYDLRFGGDNAYYAYLCSGNDVEIGSHYRPVFEGEAWLKIYDDRELVVDLRKFEDHSKMTVYRSGDYGCIIHWHD